MRTHARAVVIGGGCVGASMLYGLCKRGWTDAVLLERTELTAGSTWHAAGLIPLYSFSYSFGRLIAKTIEIYEGLEAETGQAVGWHKCGQLRLASTPERMDEYLNYMSIAETQGVRAEILSPQAVRELWPLLGGEVSIQGALYHPDDGHIAPADVTQALAAGARQMGAEIHRNTEVVAVEALASGDWRVETTQGTVVAEHVVAATGNYARQTAAMVGLDLPALPVLHQYWVTEPLPELRERRSEGLPEMPVLRDDVVNGYVREEGEGLMFGPYEAPEDLELFAVDGVPEWFGADLLPEDFEAVEGHWSRLAERLPIFERAGIAKNVRGPICIAPDNLPLAGPAWGLRNFWLAEGVSGGILMGGGLGHYLGGWIVDGEPEIDLSEIDPRRFGAHANKTWTGIKVRETFGHNFGVHYPGYEWPLGRPAKTPPAYDRLSEMGAVWGAVYGWEVPNWYAPPGVPREDEYSYRRTNYFAQVGREAEAVREAAGLLEMTPMAKFEAAGPGAAAWLDRILANRVPARIGGIALCHLLTAKGTVRAEFTVTRLGREAFYLIGTPRGERHDFDVLSKLLPADGGVTLKNVTAERGCFTVVGPRSREILQPIVETDLDNLAFPWRTSKTCSVALASDVRLLRINYEGELGWELYHPIEYQRHLVDALVAAGRAGGLKLVGNRAIESLRLEKSYRAIYRDIDVEHTALESGLDRFIKLEKGAFLGREALLEQQRRGLARRLVTLRVEAGDADAYMNEAVHREGRLVGRVTSGTYSYRFGQGIAMAYLGAEHTTIGTEVNIPILGEPRSATVIADSPYDPDNERPRS
ncbi:MAG: FAD-dependent oxidoreductase [Alphaproteobacteria bacterium]|jgi:dimethylglycine dehydrogenase|nr:FAD-dependent oxidoreductase [Alphaproteobacteria bacterium]